VPTRNAPRLREAIEFYLAQHNEELDEQARELLTRLADSDDAADAFEGLKLKRDDEGAIIRACIEAKNLARTFPERVKKAKDMLKRRKPLREAVATLRALLKEIIGEQHKPPDPLWIRGLEPCEDIAAMQRGLALFEKRIEYVEKQVAELNLFQLRVSRKSEAPSKTLSAGQFAAIGRLADEVKRVTGEAHYDEIADLAGVVFGTEVFPDQVHNAATHPPKPRARGHWQWVKPKLNTAARSRAK
jgi:hypothetical protein